MPNAIPCKFCGKQCTDHDINPLQLPVITHSKELKKRSDYGDFVCDKYTPDIKKGELKCTCTKERKWCNGLCVFKEKEIGQD